MDNTFAWNAPPIPASLANLNLVQNYLAKRYALTVSQIA